MNNIFDLIGGGSYEVKTICNNCGRNQLTKIKKGHKAQEVISNGKCSNCGCQELEII